MSKHSFVKYIGDNYGEVLDFVTSYVHSDGKNVKLYAIIPFEGDIEVQKGDYISEDDIIRYEDCYGRV